MANNAENQKITSRAEDYSEWYLDIIKAADLSDNSPVRGCMVIKPYGYAIWENIQQILNAEFKKTGVENAYFPLLIPKSFFEKEAEHVEGFAKECAVVTHHRLKLDENKKLVPDEKLEEPLIIRPTSETIMYDMYAKWIHSYRDLPLLINQWANIVRWEMRTKPFLRTTEFLWQEGHTAHATKKEADERTFQMINIYKNFAEKYLAIPAIPGYKTESEKFAGAEYTTTIEAMMQDGKALQSGTSHMLGQNFAKAFDVKFLNQEGKEEYVWQTSWGLSTRIIGAIIMAHSDDKGLVLPPNIAPIQTVIIPIWKNEEESKLVFAKAQNILESLEKNGIKIAIDKRDERPGPKFFHWERKGVPIRMEIGPKDVEAGQVVLARRDTGEKIKVKESDVIQTIAKLLQDIQSNLYNRALEYRKKMTHEVNTWDEFVNTLEKESGFMLAHWCGSPKCEEDIKEKTKATSRCIPFDQKEEKGACVYCGKPSNKRIIFAKSY